jgi:low affinity Fe/Cu permease
MPSLTVRYAGDVFDRFADAVSRRIAQAWFFAACCILVAAWVPSFILIGDVDTWQLIINTITTIVTFLMVALLQNSQQRFEDLCVAQNRELLRRIDRIESLLSQSA